MKTVIKILTVSVFVFSLASCSVEGVNDDQFASEIEATGSDTAENEIERD